MRDKFWRDEAACLADELDGWAARARKAEAALAAATAQQRTAEAERVKAGKQHKLMMAEITRLGGEVTRLHGAATNIAAALRRVVDENRRLTDEVERLELERYLATAERDEDG